MRWPILRLLSIPTVLITCFKPRKLYRRGNKSKVNSIETLRTVIAHLFPWRVRTVRIFIKLSNFLFNGSKSTMETLEKGVKYIQS